MILGDSGGPLLDKSKSLLVGVVSRGNGCAKPGNPGIYSKIGAQVSFLIFFFLFYVS